MESDDELNSDDNDEHANTIEEKSKVDDDTDSSSYSDDSDEDDTDHFDKDKMHIDIMALVGLKLFNAFEFLAQSRIIRLL